MLLKLLDTTFTKSEKSSHPNFIYLGTKICIFQFSYLLVGQRSLVEK